MRAMADRVLMKRAMFHLTALREQWEEYRAECEEYAAQGYRPHYCFHGTDLWVDWDPMCGPCEDSLTLFHLALYRAKRDVSTMRDRTDWLLTMPRDIPSALRTQLINWATEPITEGLTA